MTKVTEKQNLCQSGVGEAIWALYHSNPAEFKKEVIAYFKRGMPGWKVVKADYDKRIIWIRDERRNHLC